MVSRWQRDRGDDHVCIWCYWWWPDIIPNMTPPWLWKNYVSGANLIQDPPPQLGKNGCCKFMLNIIFRLFWSVKCCPEPRIATFFWCAKMMYKISHIWVQPSCTGDVIWRPCLHSSECGIELCYLCSTDACTRPIVSHSQLSHSWCFKSLI